MNEPAGEAPSLDSKTEASSNGTSETADTRCLQSRGPDSSPPHKTRRVDKHDTSTRNKMKNRGDDGRGRRPRRGDAKRARKEKALAEAAHMCQYFVDIYGLRRVRPYTYDFQTHTKERWLKRSVIDVFSAEFGSNPRSYYERAICCGLLKVNGKTVSPDYKLQNSDLICNRTHRHEPPVASGDITIVSESAEELAVDKPCTVPVHPCGAYRFNTLFYILQRQRPDLSLRICHRLDRLTSGLTILAKTAERASAIQKQIGAGETRKTYLARVSGDFGQNLPLARQQPGSSLTFGALSAVRTSPTLDIDDGIIKGSSPGSLLENDSPTTGTEGNAVISSVEGESTIPSASKPDNGGTPSEEVADATGELWWKFELPGEEVVRVREISDGAAAAGGQSNGEPPGSCAESGVVSCPLRHGGEKTEGVTVRVNCPIRVLNHKDGVYHCHPEGKEAQTVVRKVAYDAASDTSVVECTPVHGRTHQIRLHLQWIGHPIANDPCYGGKLHFGDPEAKLRADNDPASKGWRGTSRSIAAATSIIVDARAAAVDTETSMGVRSYGALEPKEGGGDELHTTATEGIAVGSKVETGDGRERAVQSEETSCIIHGSAGNSTSTHDADGAESERETVASKGDLETQRSDESEEAFMARTCPLCQEGERFKETQLHCAGIWLHALRYKGPDWAFQTKMPPWATF